MPTKNKIISFWPPLWWQYSCAKSDFLLRIGYLSSYQEKKTAKSHYPPPGYGRPPGSLPQEGCYNPKKRYGLFLFPGKIVRSFFWFSAILSILIFLPIAFSDSHYSLYIYLFSVNVFLLISFLFYHVMYLCWMPPILSNVWEKWPSSAYLLFLSVPHKISIKDKWEDKDRYIYWHPDTQGDMYRQTTEFAPDTQSLQEIILNFAVFECFFQRPNEQDDTTKKQKHKRVADSYEKSINEKNWYFYFLAPIWFNYLLILICLVILTGISYTTTEPTNLSPFVHLPYSFIPVIMVWFGLSLWYIQKILTGLEDLHKKIRQGAFNAHLDLVPQQILKELSNIPNAQQIDLGIQYIKKLMGIVSGIALISFLGVLEVLSQAYGSFATGFSIF